MVFLVMHECREHAAVTKLYNEFHKELYHVNVTIITN